MLMKKGDRVRVSGDSAELWIEDYNVRVSTDATVEETPGLHDKKVLLTLDVIDHDSNVCCYVRKSKVKTMEEPSGDVGKIIWSRGHKEKGVVISKSVRHCAVCGRCSCYNVKWSDGKRTKPCIAAVKVLPNGELEIE
jgi:hypothetical protein